MTKNWFTIEKIDGDTFAISEYKHWEEAHSYLLLGREGAVLIDTGLGVSAIRDVVDGLTDLPVEVLTTHVHWDHIGGHVAFAEFAVHEREVDWINGHFPLPREAVLRSLSCRPCPFPQEFSLEDYRIFQGAPSIVLRDGDEICLGGRSLKVLHTPGHSPGHCCFYEPARGYLFAGDLLYCGPLDAFYPTTDPAQFWSSIRRVCKLPLSRILPGHHSLEVPRNLPCQVDAAFQKINEAGKLKQGSGVFDFGVFQIHI